jgi:hypothetical protein
MQLVSVTLLCDFILTGGLSYLTRRPLHNIARQNPAIFLSSAASDGQRWIGSMTNGRCGTCGFWLCAPTGRALSVASKVAPPGKAICGFLWKYALQADDRSTKYARYEHYPPWGAVCAKSDGAAETYYP